MPDGTVIVTGASMGIGAAVAVEIDRRGFAVVGLSQSGTAPVGRAITCDVTDEERVRVVLAEVAAEETIVDGFLQVAVRGADETNIHLNLFRSAHRVETSILQDAQELGLRFDGHFADFIQEKRSAVGDL